MADATENTPKKDPTAQEAMFFYTMIKYMKNKADVDWDKVAAEVGFKNAGVARVRLLYSPLPFCQRLVFMAYLHTVFFFPAGPLRSDQEKARPRRQRQPLQSHT